MSKLKDWLKNIDGKKIIKLVTFDLIHCYCFSL